MNVEIDFLKNNIEDFQELLFAFEDSFEWENFEIPKHDYLEKILKNEKFVVVTAKINNSIVGGLTAYILDGYDKPLPTLYIYDLGIKKFYQNQGIGKKLINFLKEFAKNNNFSEIYVSTEELDNEQAINFYRKTDINDEMKVLHFTYYL